MVFILVSLPILFNAICLFPEVRHTTPAHNDQVFHYLFIERANQAVSAGDNPFDHWLPEIELGFPEFFYYQNLPHLTVVGLYRLMLERVSLARVLNLVRYLLLIGFPLSVYWSMRQMEFSPIAAATGAAFAPMIASNVNYGFDYASYTWNGIGMFPQLCAMHLMFIASGCVHRAVKHGEGFAAAIIASSAMVLSDLLYGYMFGIIVATLWAVIVMQTPTANASVFLLVSSAARIILRLALIFGPVAAITAYQAVPFFAENQYLNTALPPTLSSPSNFVNLIPVWPSLPHIQYSALAMPLPLRELALFFGGPFFDEARMPVFTGIVILGIIYAVITRRDEAMLALTFLAVWMMLSVPNPLRQLIVRFMPYVHLVPFFRFVAGVDFGAILVAGLGGECMWRLCRPRSSPTRALVALGLLAILFTPLVLDRWKLYQTDADDMALTDQALQEDTDLPQIFSWLKKAPPGRVYAGTRGNWGEWMDVGRLHLYDLLPFEQIPSMMPWQTLSLNAPLLWQLNIPTQGLCRLFNIRYVIAPADLKVPSFYNQVLATSRFVVYEVDSGGYMQLGQVTEIRPMQSSKELFRYNRAWINSSSPEEGKFTAFITHGQEPSKLRSLLLQSSMSGQSGSLGQIVDEAVTPDTLGANVIASTSGVLVMKMTYHPNWHVTVDGREQHTFMVSPSYIGIRIEPGRHHVEAQYRSSGMKKMLTVLSGLCLLATIVVWVARLSP